MKWPWLSRRQRIRDLAMSYVSAQFGEDLAPHEAWVARARDIAHWIETGEELPKAGAVVKGEFPRKIKDDKPS